MPRVSSRKPTQSKKKTSWIIPGIIVLVILVAGGAALFFSTRSTFTYFGFTAYKSSDGLVQFEYPDSWEVQANSSLQHSYAVRYGDAPHGVGLKVVLLPTADLLTLLQVTELTPDVTPAILLKQVFASKPAEQKTIRPVQAGAFQGAGIHYVDLRTNLTTNEKLSRDVEFWVVSLDQNHVATVTGDADTSNWNQMQPIFEHFANTLKIDAPAAIKAVGGEPYPPAALPPALAETPSAASAVSP